MFIVDRFFSLPDEIIRFGLSFLQLCCCRYRSHTLKREPKIRKIMADGPPFRHFTAIIGLQYEAESEHLNIYVKNFCNVTPAVGLPNQKCLARITVVKQPKRGWMKRQRSINLEEVEPGGKVAVETLSQRKRSTTVFNQYYSCNLPNDIRNQAALKIQFCNVNKSSQAVPIAEADFWLKDAVNGKLSEYEIPMNLTNPDLGEVEIGLRYLPTSERLSVTALKATNLKVLDENRSEVEIKIHLLVQKRTRDKRRTKRSIGSNPVFDESFIFELERSELSHSAVVITAVECCGGKEFEIGRFVLAKGDRGAEHTHWTQMLQTPRECRIENHRLMPC